LFQGTFFIIPDLYFKTVEKIEASNYSGTSVQPGLNLSVNAVDVSGGLQFTKVFEIKEDRFIASQPFNINLVP
jgi:hypothetical protein